MIAWRFLLRNKTYSLINIAGLAAGTLCCLYIMLYVQSEYSYDSQHLDVSNLYRINTQWTVQGEKGNWATVTAPVAPAMKRDFPEVEAFARIVPAIGIDHHLLRYQDKSIYEKNAVFADSSLFELFNFHFEFGQAKDALKAPFSIVLLKSVATKLFGTENPIGKVIEIDNPYGKNKFTVTGVIDESLGKSHLQADLFMSMNSGGLGSFIAQDNSWAGNNIAISYVKLYANADLAAVEKKLPAFLNKYGAKQLKSLGMSKALSLQALSSIHTTTGFKGLELSKPISPNFLSFLMLIAILIQGIACINFMNLSTARASKRAKEVGVRKTIGAARSDLIQQFLGESTLLSIISVLIALPLLALLLPLFNQITQADLHLTMLMDYRLWLMLGALIVVTALVAGSYPAFYLSGFQTMKVIKGNLSTQVSAAGIRRSLVVFQFALSTLLIFSIIVIYSQLNYIKNKDLGFEKKQKLVFSLHTNEASSNIPAFVNDVRELSAVKAVSRANNSPGELVLFDAHLFLEGGNIATAPDASLIFADENFLTATGVQLLSGRDFRISDTSSVIINEALAQTLNLDPNQAEGTKLYSQYGDGTPVTYEIAGVMKNYNFSSLHEEVKPMFITYAADPGSSVIVSTNTENYQVLLGKIATIWARNFPTTPFEYKFIDDMVQQQYATELTLSKIINSFSLLAILISCLGLLGLVAYTAEQRTKEIGIRKVLGASVFNITALLSNDFLKLVLIANGLAFPVAYYFMSKWLADFAYRVDMQWWMFVVAGVLAILIAFLTIGFQSVKAALANPVKSLRSE